MTTGLKELTGLRESGGGIDSGYPHPRPLYTW